MSAIRSDGQNAFETQLTSEMGPNDLTAAVGSIGALSSPCYLVIDYDNDAKREVILFDGSFGGSSFTTTGISRGVPPASSVTGITPRTALHPFLCVLWLLLGRRIVTLYGPDGGTQGYRITSDELGPHGPQLLNTQALVVYVPGLLSLIPPQGAKLDLGPNFPLFDAPVPYIPYR